MRKHCHSVLRLSRPLLRLEMFENRDLFSVGNSLLAPALLEPPTTPALTGLAATTANLLGASALTGAGTPNVAGTAGSPLGLNPTLNVALGSLAIPNASNSSANPIVHLGVGTSLPAIASVVVATSAGLTSGIAATLPEMIGITSPASLQVSLDVGLGPVGIAGVSAGVDLQVHAAGSLAGFSIEPVNDVNVALGGTTTTNVGVKLNAESPAVVIRQDVGAHLTLDREPDPSSSEGPPLGGNGYVGLGGNIVVATGSKIDSALAGAQGFRLQGNADSNGGVGTAVNMSGPKASTSAGVQGAAPTTEGNQDTEIPFQRDDDLQKDVIPEPARFDATLETTLENSQLIAFFPWSTSFRTGQDDLAGEAPAVRPGSSAGPAAVGQATIQSSASELDDDSPIPCPRREEGLADLLPFNLASLEGDIQAFLEQIEQLGGELSSLLARMNLSPWLMSIAVAAVAGEIVRRRFQEEPHRRPQLAACESASLAWFPGLTGPWSPKEQ
jgi:hypothetical protein